MKGAFRVGALVIVTFVAWSPDSALARQHLKCLTKRVVMVDTPKGSTSSIVEESLGFWIDERAKASCSPMAHRLQSAGSIATGLALDGTMCLTSSIVKMAR